MITDANGCTATQTITITQPGAIIPNASVVANVSCNSGTDASLTASPSGGSSPYTYNWSNGQTTQTATGLVAGSYTVTITDATGCTNTQVISVSQPAAINVTASSTPSACTSNSGTATASSSGGTGPYTYSWSDGQTASTATGLASGIYTVVVTDANGCSQTQTITVLNFTANATVTASSTIIITGNSSQLTATGGGTYLWTPASGLSCTTCSNPVATPTVTTTYCCHVIDSNGCTDDVCITINVEIPCGELFVPNAFSPNNDGENDFECVLGNCIESLTFTIFDRWGEKVFETNDPKICWDGNYHGKAMNTAVFVYQFEAKLNTGETISKKGNITLIR